MRTVRTIAETRAALASERARGRSVGLVPTMGAFHEGHLALMRAARAENDVVVVSLFVNPTQFGEAADLARYPRDEASDAALARAEGVGLLFAPTPSEMYPAGFGTWVDVEGPTDGLEGAHRPGHFRGVATVCTKLFSIVRPDRAYFGLKDAQQVAVIEQVVADLDLGLEIRPVETVRDPDGLALSSRNVFLSAEERRVALALPRALAAGRDAHAAGADPEEAALAVLAREPGLSVDYVQAARLGRRLHLLGAVRVGATRLIDNLVLAEQPGPATAPSLEEAP
ncbi:MAG: pantoate--beta-alanine ligase [Thermoleophilia bacterium]